MEEIIIDGVCINNCKYAKIIPYDYPTSGIDIECYIDYQNEITKDCKENPNCLYKQLKRLEEKYDTLTNKFFNSETDKTRLEQENEKLKKENKELTIHPVTAHYDIKRLKEEKEALQSSIKLLKKDFEQLEQENEELKQTVKDLTQSLDDCNVQRTELYKENEKLKEKIIKLTEENGNLIINRNTVENKLRDTESRLISIQKANTHNLVLLQRRNNALEEIRKQASIYANTEDYVIDQTFNEFLDLIYNKATEAIGE